MGDLLGGERGFAGEVEADFERAGVEASAPFERSWGGEVVPFEAPAIGLNAAAERMPRTGELSPELAFGERRRVIVDAIHGEGC